MKQSGLRLVRLALFLGIMVCLGLVGFVNQPVQAAAGINDRLNFQGRLLNAQGALVPDGYYNVQFKIYEGGSGAAAGNPDGTLVWTESHLNSSSTGVLVKNGYMSVELGSINPFGTQVDWNNDTLWLSMNIGNTDTVCASFATCAPDGEMLPMKRLSATPYAINSKLLGGLNSSQFIQFAQGVQTDTSATDSIAINKTGSGNFINLQSNGSTVMTINGSGDLTMSGLLNIGSTTTAGTINIKDGTANDYSGSLTVAPLSQDITYTLPDSSVPSEVICLQNLNNCADGGITAVGTLDGGTASLSGASLSADGKTIYMQSASQTNPGLINTTTQAFAGDKTFNGDLVVKSAPGGSATGFQVQDGGGLGLLTVNTASDLIQIGSATPNTDPALLVLNNYSSPTDPANGTNGSMYYNTSTNIYRCFTAGSWKNCAGAGGGIGGSGTAGAIAMFNDTYNLGPSILTQPDSSTIQVAGTLNATTSLQAPTVSLGTSGTTNGTAVFKSAGGTNTVTLGLNGNPDQSYSLYLPVVHPGTSQCLKTGFDDASQLAFGDCMAPTTPVFVQQTTNSSNGTTSLSTALTSTSQQGDLLVAVIATNGATANVSSVTDTSGNTWQRATSGTTAGSNAEIWYAANTNPTANVVINLSSSSAISVNINEYAGVSAVNALDVAQGQANPNSKTFSTPIITTSMDHDLVIAGVAYDGSKIVFPTTTGWNTLTTAAGTIGVQSSYRDAVVAGANQFDWNTSASITTGTVIAAFRPAGNGADYAEMYGTSDPSIEAADIVALDPTREASSNGNKAWIVKTDHANQSSTLGVISTHPGMIIGQLFEPSENPRAVALEGRVPVKVNGQNGPIKPGDFITTSSTPGVGMKATAAGQVVGQALSSFDGKGQGKVTMFIKNTYYAGDGSGSIAIGSLTNSVSSVNVTGLTTDSTDIQAADQPQLGSGGDEAISTSETTGLPVQDDQVSKLLSLKSDDRLLSIGDGQPTLASTSKGDLFVGGYLEVATALRIGDGLNGLNFQLGVAPSSDHGFFLGSSRPIKTIALAPEYSGLVTSGEANGQLTVDFEGDEDGFHNYYQWTTGKTTEQTVKLNVRIPVPRDWSDWTEDGEICYNVWTSDLDNSIRATVYDTDNQSNGDYEADPTETEIWQTKCSDKIGGKIEVNGKSYLTVKLELTAQPEETVRLGEFNFDYLSAF